MWLKPSALRFYRLAVIVAIVWIIHKHHARLKVDEDAPVRVEEVRAFFAGAARLEADESERQGLFVLDRQGNRVGYVLRTSPMEDHLVGYSGPTDTLVALDPEMRVVGVRIRSSWDTKQHVHDVATDETSGPHGKAFLKTWDGKTWEQVAGMVPAEVEPKIEGVSGASLTSLTIANGIQQRFKQVIDAEHAPAPKPRFTWRDGGLVAVILVAMLFSFTSLRGRGWARRIFQVVLIGYVGFWNGQLLAQSLFAGWAGGGVPWRLAPGLVLLAAAALIVPWTTRRALYCSQICPHGAAQELVGRLWRRKLRLPRGVEAGLRWMPWLLIAFVLTVAIYRLPIELAGVEPFDAYLVHAAGWATITIAVVGLVAALFVPMAYCKYGCPTGALLGFVRSHGKADVFGRRDLAAGVLVLLAVALYWTYGGVHHWIVR
jgi:hypothetical protein